MAKEYTVTFKTDFGFKNLKFSTYDKALKYFQHTFAILLSHGNQVLEAKS